MTLLKELYPVRPTPEVAKALGRTIPAVKQQAYVLGLKIKTYSDRRWTAEELELLRELYPTCKSTREVAAKIGRPWGSVRQIASNLGITKGGKHPTRQMRDYRKFEILLVHSSKNNFGKNT